MHTLCCLAPIQVWMFQFFVMYCITVIFILAGYEKMDRIENPKGQFKALIHKCSVYINSIDTCLNHESLFGMPYWSLIAYTHPLVQLFWVTSRKAPGTTKALCCSKGGRGQSNVPSYVHCGDVFGNCAQEKSEVRGEWPQGILQESSNIL